MPLAGSITLINLRSEIEPRSAWEMLRPDARGSQWGTNEHL
jgi:hypothetical protein